MACPWMILSMFVTWSDCKLPSCFQHVFQLAINDHCHHVWGKLHDRIGAIVVQVALLYDTAFWASTAWLNRLPAAGHCWQNRWQEMFNMAKYIPELPMLVAFTAADPAWEAQQATDQVLIQQVMIC